MDSLTMACVADDSIQHRIKQLLEQYGVVGTRFAKHFKRRPEVDAVLFACSKDEFLRASFNDTWEELHRSLQGKAAYLNLGSAHELSHILLALDVGPRDYLQVLERLSTIVPADQRRRFYVSHSIEDAITQVVWAGRTSSLAAPASALDGIAAVAEFTNDLRNRDGRLDADLAMRIFGLESYAEIAQLAKISRQAVSQDKSTPGIQPVLEELEKISRARALPQLRRPEAFKAWWRRKLPALRERSPYEAWLDGKGHEVIDLVDRLLTGDVGG